ncbi:MAG TPA: tetratricopeptide repeat protein, partial [Bacteroidales bacterium]|nr:tetratricopeptide repeat protein [Bacteroidales bacterium]
YITLSDIYLLMGQPDPAGGALKKALELDPSNNDALLKSARLCLIQRDYQGTNGFVQQAIRNRPNNPVAYYIHALALLETGDTLHAVSDLLQANSMDQKNYDVLVQLGELLALKKDPLAAGYLKNAIALRPGSREALYMLGMFYQETGQYGLALQTYDLLSRVDTTYRNAPYNTGYIYLVYLHDFDKAVYYFSQALKRDPVWVEAWFNRGYAYELKKDYAKAAADYQKALQLHPNYEKAVEGLNRLDKVQQGR